ncbi:MAG: SDR family NAD(P)-dependent oxidoreductase [Candidatus Sericytochromatia bacterium]|nr:SDR family NAD(P)-dependent oxidoreductase [Candidatus Sericytochromatia bacterium]
MTQSIDAKAASTPIAIVGLACLFPKAQNLGYYWGNIKRAVDGIGPVPETHWKPADYYDPDPKRPDHTYAQRGGFIDPVPFDPTAYGIAPHALEATDPAQVLGLVVASEALRHAGYGPDRSFDRSRVSVVLGVTGTLQLVIPLGARLGHPHWRRALLEAGVPADQADDVVARLEATYVPWQEASFPGLLGNVVAGRIANRLDLGGTNCVVDAACASSLSAIHLAALELSAGRSSMVITGGVDAFNDIFMYMCFSKTPALSPTGNARPFDAEGDGTILGEGVGMVVLKRLDEAERDGDTIYAVLKGVGTASDGRGKAIYAPDDDGQQRALTAAYAAAEVTPATIELLEGHGTGTKVGDAIEVTALRRIYGEAEAHRPHCALGSVKSQIGHTKAAAGAAGLIKAVLALHHKVLPPTCKVKQPLPGIQDAQSPFYLPAEPRPWLRRRAHPRRAAVSSFGFGGSNFHVVLEEHKPERRATDWDGRVQLVTLSADSLDALHAALKPFGTLESWEDLEVAACDARAGFHPGAAHRLAFVVERDSTQVADLVARLLARTAEGRDFEFPDGACYASGPSAGGLAVLFPGQGAQYVGMGRTLACAFPEALEALEEAEVAFGLEAGGELPHGSRLIDRIYPLTAYDAAGVTEQEEQLRATDVAQPAIGAVSLGMWSILANWGLRPVAAAGHSYGELTALMASGRLSRTEFLELSVLRGRLMAAGTEARGSMLAVLAPLTELEAWLARHGEGLVLANRNTPNQGVISGSRAAIARAETELKAAGMRVAPLAVGAAFHSPLVADAADPLAAALARMPLPPASFPVYSNTLGGLYPGDAAESRALLASQLARPVDWIGQIEAMYAAGVRVFLEVGPGSRLSGMVRAILGDRPHTAIALDASQGKRDGLADLARAMAQLCAVGHPIDLTQWQGGAAAVASLRERKRPKMKVMVSGALYRDPRRPTSLPPAAGDRRRPTATAESLVTSPHSEWRGPEAATPVADHEAVKALIQASTDTIAAWQASQQEAAAMHQAFLESQRASQETFRRLMDQQRELLAKLGGETEPPGEATAAGARPAIAPAAAATVEATRRALRGMRFQAAKPSAPSQAAVEPLPEPPARQESVASLPPVAPVQPANPGSVMPPIDVRPLPLPRRPQPTVASAPAAETPVSPPERSGAMPPAPLRQPEPAPAQLPKQETAVPLDGVRAELLAVVSEKTGYPPETLELDMALEGDLGIDSIKRVEILSALIERLPGTRPLGPEEAGALRSLRDVAVALAAQVGPALQANGATSAPLATPSQPERTESRPSLPPPAGTAPVETGPAPLESPAPSAAAHSVEALLGVVSEKTGYPVDTLELDMALEGDLGIDSIKRVEILSALVERIPGAHPLGPEQAGGLRTLRDVAEALAAQAAPAEALPAGPAPALAGPQAEPVNDQLGLPAWPEPLMPERPPASAGLPPSNGGAQEVSGAHAATDALLAVVSEKTGYPIDTLELDMALEGDLGIDSIKRVEILSALVERLPGARPLGPEQAGSLHTLRDVVTAMESATGSQQPPVDREAPPAVNGANPPMTASQVSWQTLTAAVQHLAEAPLLPAVPEPDSGLRPLVPADFNPAPSPALSARWQLAQRAADPATALGLSCEVPSLSPLPVTDRLAQPKLAPGATVWVAGPPGHGLVTTLVECLRAAGLTAVAVNLQDSSEWTVPGELAGLVLVAPQGDGPTWSASDEGLVKRAFQLTVAAAPLLQANRGWFVTVARMDGAFGLVDASLPFSPLAGALAGLAKTAAHEWPDTICQAFDLHPGWDDAAAALALVDEITLPGPSEVALGPNGRFTLVLEPAGPASARPLSLQPGDLVVLTGGGRGVTAEVAVAIALAYRPVVVLLGRTELPEGEPTWLAQAQDEAAIKRAISDHSDHPLAPREISARWQEVAAAREVARTLARLAALGVTARYVSVDVRDTQALTDTLASLRQDFGPVRMLVHGAGVLADKAIADKTPAQFDRVFDTKVAGLRALWQALDVQELRHLVLFSSITARVGRLGQSDYAMANEVLNKFARRLSATQPTLRVMSVGWGPWDGGMVTPALKAMFAAEGVGILPLNEGSVWLAAELGRDRPAAPELIVLGPTDGLRVASENQAAPVVAPAPAEERLQTVMRRDLAVRTHPFMGDHVLNGKAVLPVAIMLEWMVHAASQLRPGAALIGFDDFELLKGVVLEVEPYGLRFDAGKPVSDPEGQQRVKVELYGDGRERPLSHTTVLLGADRAAGPERHWSHGWQGGLDAWPYFRSVEEAYRSVLFHGPTFHGLLTVDVLGPEGVLGKVQAAGNPQQWMQAPVRDTWLTEPLAIDAMFQMLILWSVETLGAACLPCRVSSFRMYRPFQAPSYSVAVHVTARRVGTVLADVAFLDPSGQLVAEFRGAECTFATGLVEAFRRNTLSAPMTP